VDQTLAFVANNSAPGNSIIFDYLNAEVVDGTSQDPLAEALVEMGANIGEHYKFGLKPESVAGFLSDRGFNCLGHFTLKECKEMYCGQSQRDRKVIGLFSIVQAATGNQTDGTAL
jgi:O-methyltransferase involved in polyketide biosynthesis